MLKAEKNVSINGKSVSKAGFYVFEIEKCVRNRKYLFYMHEIDVKSFIFSEK